MMQQQGVVHVHRVHRMKPVCFRCKKNSEQASIPESKGSFRNIFVKNKKILLSTFLKKIYTHVAHPLGGWGMPPTDQAA
jgi:hypothetical protein